MIRFRLKELMAEKGFRESRVVTMLEVAEATEINRGVLSKIANERGGNTVTDNLDRLCKFFNCKLEELAQYVEDEQNFLDDKGKKSAKKASAKPKISRK